MWRQVNQPWKSKVMTYIYIYIYSRFPFYCFCGLGASSRPPPRPQTSESLWEMEGGMFRASPLVDICNGNDLLRPHKQEKRVRLNSAPPKTYLKPLMFIDQEWRHMESTVSSSSRCAIALQPYFALFISSAASCARPPPRCPARVRWRARCSTVTAGATPSFIIFLKSV